MLHVILLVSLRLQGSSLCRQSLDTYVNSQ